MQQPGATPTKFCSVCKLVKSADRFYSKKNRPNSYSQCKDCRNVEINLWKKTNKELYKLQKHKAKLATYNLTLEQHELLLEAQENVCAICKRPETRHNQHGLVQLSIDHNHITGEVRGLLCDRCNKGLGHFKDNPEFLAEAKKYLEKGSYV